MPTVELPLQITDHLMHASLLSKEQKNEQKNDVERYFGKTR